MSKKTLNKALNIIAQQNNALINQLYLYQKYIQELEASIGLDTQFNNQQAALAQQFEDAEDEAIEKYGVFPDRMH